MNKRKCILLKVSGTIFPLEQRPNTAYELVKQINQLKDTYQFGVVIGGGNILRGKNLEAFFKTKAMTNHYGGMLATMINGLFLNDLLEQEGLKTQLFSALYCPEIGTPISPESITQAKETKNCFVFAGGSGNPYVTTDTTAIIRALEINAEQVWKGTDVDGIYEEDPRHKSDTTFLPKISYQDALLKKIGIMDHTALALAQEHRITIRVFNIFKENALIQATKNIKFGSTIFREG